MSDKKRVVLSHLGSVNSASNEKSNLQNKSFEEIFTEAQNSAKIPSKFTRSNLRTREMPTNLLSPKASPEKNIQTFVQRPSTAIKKPREKFVSVYRNADRVKFHIKSPQESEMDVKKCLLISSAVFLQNFIKILDKKPKFPFQTLSS